jgi:hypothetical protein
MQQFELTEAEAVKSAAYKKTERGYNGTYTRFFLITIGIEKQM